MKWLRNAAGEDILQWLFGTWLDLSDLFTDREPKARNNNIASFRVSVLISLFLCKVSIHHLLLLFYVCLLLKRKNSYLWKISASFLHTIQALMEIDSDFVTGVITGLPVRPSHKMDFRSSSAKNGLPGEGRHEGLVPRNDVLTNGFIWFSLARTLARILFVPRLRSPWKTHKALRTWRRLFALFEATRSWESLYNFFIVRV